VWKWIVALGATLVAAVAAHAAYAAITTTSVTGKAVTQVKVVRQQDDDDLVLTHSAAFVNLPGASATISVPSSTTALLLIRFSGYSQCQGNPSLGGSTCSVKVLVDGQPVSPDLWGFDYSPASGSVASNPFVNREFERATDKLAPGTHTVQVQWAVSTDPNLNPETFRLKGWNLVIERVKR
jgi:hypothetical protein